MATEIRYRSAEIYRAMPKTSTAIRRRRARPTGASSLTETVSEIINNGAKLREKDEFKGGGTVVHRSVRGITIRTL